MFQSYLVAFLTFSTLMFGATDPLGEVDRFLAPVSFPESFLTNDEVIIKQTSCISSGFCDEYQFKNRADKVTDSDALIGSYRNDGSKMGSFLILKTTWETLNGNQVRRIVAELAEYGFKTEVTKVETIHRTIQVNNLEETREGRLILISAENGAGQIIKVNLEVVNLPGIAQLYKRTQTTNFGVETNQVVKFSRFLNSNFETF